MARRPERKESVKELAAASQALLDRFGAVGRRLPEPVARLARPSYRRLVAATQAVRPARSLEEPPTRNAGELFIPARRALGPEPEVIVEIPPLPPGKSALTVWPQVPPPGYRGQLEAGFQLSLARQWEGVSLADCYFYHRVRLADGRIVDGVWNLLGGEHEYLGGVPVRGRRVLELGPASGWLTTWMEQQGADVVGFDLGWDLAPDLLPLPQFDPAELRQDQIEFVAHVQNAWWLLRREHGLSARAVYGSIYELPTDIGRYDVAVFGSILLHLRDPFLALRQAAERTDEAIVVVEPLAHDASEVKEPIARWNPTHGVSPNGWWAHSPGLITSMLSVLGFTDCSVTYHWQPYRPELRAAAAHVDTANYTVVARRPA